MSAHDHLSQAQFTTPVLSHGHNCVDCEAEAETVPASYQMPNGDHVCDTHLDIRAEG